MVAVSVKDLIVNYYSRDEVAKEISDFLKDRWVALEGSAGDRRIFVRYEGRKPLKVEKAADVKRLVRRYLRLNVRTFYGTVNVYKDLSNVKLIEDPNNVIKATQFWDIDTVLSKWSYAVRAAEVIGEFLEKEGVKESLYLLWSGEGIHVRVNENAFSPEILSKHHPTVVAHSVVQYVLKKVKDKLEPIVKASAGVVKVENLIDFKRVFTAPLSLHRRLNYSAICLTMDDLPSFNLDWINPENPKHKGVWRRFSAGEADNLALKALREIKPQTRLISVTRSVVGVETKPQKREIRPKEAEGVNRLGRFPVMAILQAARYFILTGDVDKAKSFGLNRAIFYAWAKHYGRAYAARKLPRRYAGSGPSVPEEGRKLVKVAGEEVFTSPRGWFVIGDREQLPEDYDRNVTSKIDGIIPYDIAWEAALKYVSSFPKEVLTSQREFYEKVYLPVRDSFIEKVVEGLVEAENEGTTKKPEHEAKQPPPKSGDVGKRTPRKGRTLLDFMRSTDKN
jgi:hypothetical protein